MSKQGGENGGIFGFVRNSESEKNERNDEEHLKSMYKTHVSEKRISQKNRTRPDNIRARVWKS